MEIQAKFNSAIASDYGLSDAASHRKRKYGPVPVARRSTRLVFCLAVGAFCAGLEIFSAQPAIGALLTVSWGQGRLSVDTVGAPLAKVLAEVANQTGLRVEGDCPMNQTVQAHFSSLPLREALVRLLSGVNFAIVERPHGSAGACQYTLFVLDNNATRTTRQWHDSAAGNSDAGNPDERLARVYQAAEAGDLGLLKRAASARNTDATKVVALDLLAQKDPGAAAGVALAASGSSDLGQRVMGLQALARFESPAAVKALGAALNDSDTGVRETALAGLARQSSSEAMRLLQQAAEDSDPSIEQFAKSLLTTRNGHGLPTESGLNNDSIR